MSDGCNWQHTSYGRMVCFVSCIVHWNFPGLILILWKKFTHGQPSTCRWKYVDVIIRNKSCVGNFIQELKLVKRKDIAEKVKWHKQFIKHCTNLWMSNSCVSRTWKCRCEQGLWEGVQPVHIGPGPTGPESQEGACESLKGQLYK
jgi:hypothetical protein